LSLALAACGGDDDDNQASAREAALAREVGRTIERLERATAKRDFKTICGELFSEPVRRQAGGRECASLLRRSAGDVRRPRIDVIRIDIKGDTATARVRTSARGQTPATDTIRLVREDGRFRISSLR
jgi:hypothetical protein